MSWKRHVVQCGIELMALAIVIIGIYWSCYGITGLISLATARFFPGGLAALILWAPGYVMAVIFAYGLTIAGVLWAMLGVIRLASRRLGGQMPPAQEKSYYD